MILNAVMERIPTIDEKNLAILTSYLQECTLPVILQEKLKESRNLDYASIMQQKKQENMLKSQFLVPQFHKFIGDIFQTIQRENYTIQYQSIEEITQQFNILRFKYQERLNLSKKKMLKYEKGKWQKVELTFHEKFDMNAYLEDNDLFYDKMEFIPIQKVQFNFEIMLPEKKKVKVQEMDFDINNVRQKINDLQMKPQDARRKSQQDYQILQVIVDKLNAVIRNYFISISTYQKETSYLSYQKNEKEQVKYHSESKIEYINPSQILIKNKKVEIKQMKLPFSQEAQLQKKTLHQRGRSNYRVFRLKSQSPSPFQREPKGPVQLFTLDGNTFKNYTLAPNNYNKQ